MKRVKQLLTVVSLILLGSLAHASDNGDLVKKIREAKFTLKDAIAYAERTSGPATSAKFEMDGSELVFSVYTAPQGLRASAEETDLTELSGSAVLLPIQAKTEVFADKEHIARASTHLTLMQLSRLTLAQVIDEAQECYKGIVFSIKNPQVRDRKAVADVSILTPDNHVVVVSIDLMTGEEIN